MNGVYTLVKGKLYYDGPCSRAHIHDFCIDWNIKHNAGVVMLVIVSVS